MSLTSKGAGVVSEQSRAAEDAAVILYTNWRGETAVRRIVPGSEHPGLTALWYGETEWHPGQQWLLAARDVEKDVHRVFALSGIIAWGQEAVDAALATPPSDPASVSGQPAPVVPDEVRREQASKLVNRVIYDGMAHAHHFRQRLIEEITQALVATPSRRADTPLGSGDDGIHRCGICDQPLTAGQPVLTDVELGTVHAACCGPERESYVKDIDTGEPLAPDDPVPSGRPYEQDTPLGGGGTGPGWTTPHDGPVSPEVEAAARRIAARRAGGAYADAPSVSDVAWRSEIHAAESADVLGRKVVECAIRLVTEIQNLADDSEGIAGLHRNGDVASWEEVLPGGQYEQLPSLEPLREALTSWALGVVPAAPEPAAGGEREIVRHLKSGGTYEVLGEAEAQVSVGKGWRHFPTGVDLGDAVPARVIYDGLELTVYRNPQTGKLWCCFPDEFRDGRFETISTPSEAGAAGDNSLQWAIDRWRAEVGNRPHQNVHRRALDTTWRQVIRRLGGDADALVGPSHDDLVNAPPPTKPRADAPVGGA